jgi:hypothetical protein
LINIKDLYEIGMFLKIYKGKQSLPTPMEIKQGDIKRIK